MKKLFSTSLIIIMIFVLASLAQAGMLIPASDQAEDKAQAPKNSQAINQTESGEWELDRIDFIHYAKPDNTGKPEKPGKPPKQDSCYKLLGLKWKSLPVDYVINPTNQDGLTENFITSTIASSAEVWDDTTSQELFNNVYEVNNSALYGVQNFKNAIVFDNDGDNNVIGITSVWYTRRGKQIVEFDIKFNDYYLWGDATASSSFMDLANIATHELGHAIGMDDIYSTSCSEVTMYGYSGYGETKKRDLEPADITGLQSIYGI
jgi:hypothetical protein